MHVCKYARTHTLTHTHTHTQTHVPVISTLNMNRMSSLQSRNKKNVNLWRNCRNGGGGVKASIDGARILNRHRFGTFRA